MNKRNILIFPCGSEIGLELHRSLRYSAHFNIIGASSVYDHGIYTFDQHIDLLPFFDRPEFIERLKEVVVRYRIDAIYPTMDGVIACLKRQESYLGCLVISSPLETATICTSKSAMYKRLNNVVKTPLIYKSIDQVRQYPVFLKPDVGYGSRGVRLAVDIEQASMHLREYPESLIMEYLPGEEYTVDNFTDRHGKLRFVGPRVRGRIMNGISVNTVPIVGDHKEFVEIAEKINQKLSFRGAWFFQVKRDLLGRLTLLEVAARLGGSSAVYRNQGVNFALLTVFDAFGYDVEVMPNEYGVELDRALSNNYRLDIVFDTVYIDFDDCMIIDGKVNLQMLSLVYKAINEKKKVVLLTKHEGDIKKSLQNFRMGTLFDEVISLPKGADKSKYITSKKAIFIDDSFSERKQVKSSLGIPVFSPDMVESLLG